METRNSISGGQSFGGSIEVTYLCGGQQLSLFFSSIFFSFFFLIFFSHSFSCFFLFLCFILCFVVCLFVCLLACGTPNGIKPQDPIRCRSCGGRILYKARTKRCQFKFYQIILNFLFLSFLVIC